MSTAMASNSPIPVTRLAQITDDACDFALHSATSYAHASTAAWNSEIINTILKKLIEESSDPSTAEDSAPTSTTPKYKFCVNSTIIQNFSDPAPVAEVQDETTEDGNDKAVAGGAGVGRRGMHSASGAYWNNEKDGMWSHKYQGASQMGMDVVVSVMWIAV